MSSNRRDQALPSHQDIKMVEITNQNEGIIDLTNTPSEVLENFNLYYGSPWFSLFADVTPAMNATIQTELILRKSLATHILYATAALPTSTNPEDIFKLEALGILEKNPRLLFMEGIKATSPTGAICQGSPLQLALGAGDAWLVKALKESVFPKHSRDAEQAQALFDEQFQAQFPYYKTPLTLDSILAKTPDLVFSEDEKAFFELEHCYYDERNIQQIVAVKRALMAVVNAITADNCQNAMPNQETLACIDKLKTALAPDDKVIIKTGLHFPLFMLVLVADVYRAQYVASCKTTPPAAGAWDTSGKAGEKWSVYWRLVLGLVEKHLTAVDGQILKSGLVNNAYDLNKETGLDRQDGLFTSSAKGSPALAVDLGQTAFVTPLTGSIGYLSSDPCYFDVVEKNGKKERRRACGGLIGGYFLESLCRNKSSYYSTLLKLSKHSQDVIPRTNHCRGA